MSRQYAASNSSVASSNTNATAETNSYAARNAHPLPSRQQRQGQQRQQHQQQQQQQQQQQPLLNHPLENQPKYFSSPKELTANPFDDGDQYRRYSQSRDVDDSTVSSNLLPQHLPALPMLNANGGGSTGDLTDAARFRTASPVQDGERLTPPQLHYSENSGASTTVGTPQGSPKSVPSDPQGFRARVRRAQTMRRVELVQGNLVLECPVPTKLLQAVPHRDGQEFTHMRYSAATTDPNDFVNAGYTLRPSLYGRETELFIVMTMYNENDVLLCRTLSGVMKNVANLCNKTKSKTWGKDGWQKVVVCIVADGRKKCHPRVLTVLQSMGVYQDGIAKNSVNGKDVTAHIYEYTAQISVDPDLNISGADAGIMPVQIIFCMKEQNKKKLNSHRWFFNAFSPLLNPKVCVLLDVGTRPSSSSIYHLWKAFDRNPNVAGACGEICAMLGPKKSYLLNPLVAAQNFEYKMSNILDKPLESLFGYISVLPGAFSAYRYIALKDSRPGVGPLSSYFKGEELHGAASSGIFEANMYLAEDRILCFELFAKPKASWTLHYVKSAKAETDVPDNVPELISQRRRWLNGSFFAALFAITHANNVWNTTHSTFRKVAFMIENVYMIINLYFSWFALGNFYITFFYLGRAFAQSLTVKFEEGSFLAIASGAIFTLFQQLYLITIIIIVVCSMGNRPQGSKFFYTFSMILFAILMAFMLLSAAVLTKYSLDDTFQQLHITTINATSALILVQDNNFQKVVLSLLSTYGLYFASSLLHAEPWHMIHSFVQYLFILPSYVNILNIYAFSNVHDVSWGTKGDNTAATDLGAVVVKTGAGGAQMVDVEVPTEQVDINANYEQALRELKSPLEEESTGRDAKTKKDDYYRGFRTRLVLAWMISNGALISILTSDWYLAWMSRGSALFNPYLSFIFWSVAALAAVRFVGSTLFLFARMIFG